MNFSFRTVRAMARGLSPAFAIALASSAVAHAQCFALTGSPAPTPEYYAANQIKLKYLASGPGFGDDRPELNKSTFNAAAIGTFDPQNVHSVHLTFLNDTSGLTMWSTSVPPSTTLWSVVTLPSGVIRYTYNDPAATFAIKKMQILAYPGGLMIIKYARAVNQSIVNVPAPTVDGARAIVQIESGGAGLCAEGATFPCTGLFNTKTCRR